MSDINYGEILEALNEKADRDLNNRSDDSGLRKLVEIYNNGTSWYKVYDEIQSDGTVKKWCEQGGQGSASTSSTSITLLKEYTNTSYIVTLGMQYTTTASTPSSVDNKTTTGFRITQGNNANLTTWWRAEGYIA